MTNPNYTQYLYNLLSRAVQQTQNVINNLVHRLASCLNHKACRLIGGIGQLQDRKLRVQHAGFHKVALSGFRSSHQLVLVSIQNKEEELRVWSLSPDIVPVRFLER